MKSFFHFQGIDISITLPNSIVFSSGGCPLMYTVFLNLCASTGILLLRQGHDCPYLISSKGKPSLKFAMLIVWLLQVWRWQVGGSFGAVARADTVTRLRELSAPSQRARMPFRVCNGFRPMKCRYPGDLNHALLGGGFGLDFGR